MFVAITGTPGTGKSLACKVLSEMGYNVIDLNKLAEEKNLISDFDEKRQTREVDVERLARELRSPTKITFLQGHFSHLMPANVVVVLRCHPKELRRRLEARGWPKAKIRENVEAEALDVITIEAVQRGMRTYEIDTTKLQTRDIATRILQILQGATSGHEPGSVDWSDEVLEWY